MRAHCVNIDTHTQTAAVALALEVITLSVAPWESKFPMRGKSMVIIRFLRGVFHSCWSGLQFSTRGDAPFLPLL